MYIWSPEMSSMHEERCVEFAYHLNCAVHCGIPSQILISSARLCDWGRLAEIGVEYLPDNGFAETSDVYSETYLESLYEHKQLLGALQCLAHRQLLVSNGLATDYIDLTAFLIFAMSAKESGISTPESIPQLRKAVLSFERMVNSWNASPLSQKYVALAWNRKNIERWFKVLPDVIWILRTALCLADDGKKTVCNADIIVGSSRHTSIAYPDSSSQQAVYEAFHTMVIAVNKVIGDAAELSSLSDILWKQNIIGCQAVNNRIISAVYKFKQKCVTPVINITICREDCAGCVAQYVKRLSRANNNKWIINIECSKNYQKKLKLYLHQFNNVLL